MGRRNNRIFAPRVERRGALRRWCALEAGESRIQGEDEEADYWDTETGVI